MCESCRQAGAQGQARQRGRRDEGKLRRRTLPTLAPCASASRGGPAPCVLVRHRRVAMQCVLLDGPQVGVLRRSGRVGGRGSSDGDEGDEGLAGRRSRVGVGVEAVGGRSKALDRPLSGRGGARRTRLREGREALRASESRSLPRLVPATGPRGEQPVAFPASMAHRLDRSPTRELASIPASARAANRSQSRARRSARTTTTSRTEGVAAQKPQQSVPDLIY